MYQNLEKVKGSEYYPNVLNVILLMGGDAKEKMFILDEQ